MKFMNFLCNLNIDWVISGRGLLRIIFMLRLGIVFLKVCFFDEDLRKENMKRKI